MTAPTPMTPEELARVRRNAADITSDLWPFGVDFAHPALMCQSDADLVRLLATLDAAQPTPPSDVDALREALRSLDNGAQGAAYYGGDATLSLDAANIILDHFRAAPAPKAAPAGLDVAAWAKWIVEIGRLFPGGVADWACAECKPESDMLDPGWRCPYHDAAAYLASTPADPKEPTE